MPQFTLRIGLKLHQLRYDFLVFLSFRPTPSSDSTVPSLFLPPPLPPTGGIQFCLGGGVTWTWDHIMHCRRGFLVGRMRADIGCSWCGFKASNGLGYFLAQPGSKCTEFSNLVRSSTLSLPSLHSHHTGLGQYRGTLPHAYAPSLPGCLDRSPRTHYEERGN